MYCWVGGYVVVAFLVRFWVVLVCVGWAVWSCWLWLPLVSVWVCGLRYLAVTCCVLV